MVVTQRGYLATKLVNASSLACRRRKNAFPHTLGQKRTLGRLLGLRDHRRKSLRAPSGRVMLRIKHNKFAGLSR